MTLLRLMLAAAFSTAMIASALPGSAQPYGGPPRPFYPPPGHHHGHLALFQVAQWVEVEDGFEGIWTFDMGAQRRTMSAEWRNTSTGRRQFARNMHVRREGQQVIISRPGLGNYVGTIQPAGDEIQGTISWTGGRFKAHIRQ